MKKKHLTRAELVKLFKPEQPELIEVEGFPGLVKVKPITGSELRDIRASANGDATEIGKKIITAACCDLEPEDVEQLFENKQQLFINLFVKIGAKYGFAVSAETVKK